MAKKFLDTNGLSHLWSKLKEKFAAKSHKHTKSEITDFPTIPTFDTAATANTAVKRDSSGNINANYLQGTWLKATATGNMANTPTMFCVLNGEKWMYYRTAAQMKSDLGIPTITLTENDDGTVDISIT